MTDAEERDLWIQFKEHEDTAARDILVVHHMRVVKYIAGRMAIHVPQSVEMDDLVGWGVLGLMDAIEKFDHRQDIRFPTYATARVRGAIIDQIRSLDWAPRSLRAMARKVGQAKNKLRQETATEPTAEAIAAELGTTEEHVEDTIAQIQTAHVLSLDDYLPNEDAETARKVDVTSEAGALTPEDVAVKRERIDLLADAILELPDQQQKVLNLYYYKELTLKEIGVVLDVSESRVCQVHTAAMKTLRKILQRRGA